MSDPINTFNVTIYQYKDGKRIGYNRKVDHIYSSDQVERFKIYGSGNKVMIIEKRLMINKQPWKIIEGLVNTDDIEKAAMAIFNLQNALDEYLDEKSGKKKPRQY